ncbi:MAG: asparagine synthase (glutamine-hydrolyzing) [Myxococcales bacterium]|nr:asparagine synthase (glutamine-hydrolyzing) [Myxococcales bacterium]
MCGIAGIVGRHDPDLLAAMTASLRHRGPDGDGLFTDPHGPVGLGHRRLAIIDLAAGAQPMASPDGRAVITYNGETYNYAALRRELLAAGAIFNTESDTEVLLVAYQRWGPALLERLRGMFAFALWDSDTKTLFIARDRLGIKPLYYATLADGTLLFGSEPKALLRCPEVDRGLDLTSLDAYLDLYYVPPPRSIFRGIRQLPPGHSLTWHKGQVIIKRWWDPAPRPADPGLDSLDAWAEATEPVLREAVKLHTISEVPLGAFLSGGLDSSTIVACMTDPRAQPRVDTFCVGYGPEGASYEERPVARRVAAALHANHRELQLDIRLLDDLEPLVRGFDEPFGSWAALLSYKLSAFTRQFVTVALAGDGGDEVFGGYPRYRGLVLSERLSHAPGLLINLARRVLARAGEPTTARSLRRWARQFLEGVELPPARRYAAWVGYARQGVRDGMYTDATRAAVAEAGRVDYIADAFAEPARGDLVQRAGYADLRGFLPENVLRGSDRMSMAHGLEVRVPFCDHVLVELLAGAPAPLKVTARASKRILRRVMRGHVPDEVLTRKKLGFNAPFGTWLKQAEDRITGDWLHPDQVARRGIFKPAEIARLLGEHRTGVRDHGIKIWSLMILEQWQRMYMD